jgi:hypothetical protein
MTDNLDLIAGSAPSAESAPEAQPDKPTPEQTVDLAISNAAAPVVIAEVVAERKRKYIPCTGSQITTFLKAANAGMKEPHFASEDEVEAFVKERGL